MRTREAFALALLLLLFSVAPAAAHADGISDNSFLIEEAYNQDPGVVQHIGNVVVSSDADSSRRRAVEATFTQEWPVRSIRHQLSYTIPFSGAYVKPRNAAQYETHDEGVGDIALNYRYALMLEDPMLPAMAPRASLILPTGDETRGLSTGEMGYQVALPISKQLGGKLALHGNASFTLTPGVSTELPTGVRSRKTDLIGYSLGGSMVLIASGKIQPLVEVVSSWEDGIEPTGLVTRTETTLVSPGVRWAFNTSGGAQLCMGLAAPIGVSEGAPPLGGLFYLSFEHAFAHE